MRSSIFWVFEKMEAILEGEDYLGGGMGVFISDFSFLFSDLVGFLCEVTPFSSTAFFLSFS
jgi:hypothetical protein